MHVYKCPGVMVSVGVQVRACKSRCMKRDRRGARGLKFCKVAGTSAGAYFLVEKLLLYYPISH